MSDNWGTVVDESEPWPRLKTRRSTELAHNLNRLFIIYVEKTLRWLDYFVMDPRWLNLTAVNYAANAAREAASEVRETRIKFEKEFELTREDLGASPIKPEAQNETSSGAIEQAEPEDDTNAA